MSKNTKHVLGESLKKLIQKKPLNKITVTEIVTECGLNRMTFYYHFKDIYDLLEWVCLEDAKRALDSINNTYVNWKDGLYKVFLLVQENRSFVMHVYNSISNDYLEMYIYRLTDALFMAVIDEMDKDKALNYKDKEFIASFYKFAFLGIMLNWIDNNMQEDPRDIIDRLSILVEEDLSGAVERFKSR